MLRLIASLVGVALFSASGFGQSSGGGFKSYKTQEAYCLDNPKAPTCIKIPKIHLSDIHPGMGSVPQQQTARPEMVSPVGRDIPASAVPLQDWRFAHSSPAMLMVINVKSLVQSPLLATVFSMLGGAGAKELDNIRAAVSDVGQILISVAASNGEAPSTLMLIRGNVDGPLSTVLKSSKGMQTHRIDAFSMLVGDASAVGFATLRLKSTNPQTSGRLLRVGTLEGMKYDIWMGIDPRYLRSAGFGLAQTSSEEIDILSRLNGMSAGLYVRDQIRVEAMVEAPSPEMADRMLAAYREMEAKEKPGDNPFGKQIWASTEGSKIRFVAIADLARLKDTAGFHNDAAQMIGPQLGPLIQAITALKSGNRPASAQSPAQPKAQQGAIVINGLAGGPKEI
ncbi:MAG: hypothetical protein ABIZ80_24785, partial [Bryobacteraceae bacterium]